jgi:hypothetical protein
MLLGRKTMKYKTKPEEVDVIVWTPQTRANKEIEDTMGVCYGYCAKKPHLHVGERMFALDPGDMIVTDIKGVKTTVTPTELAERYEKVE